MVLGQLPLFHGSYFKKHFLGEWFNSIARELPVEGIFSVYMAHSILHASVIKDKISPYGWVWQRSPFWSITSKLAHKHCSPVDDLLDQAPVVLDLAGLSSPAGQLSAPLHSQRTTR